MARVLAQEYLPFLLAGFWLRNVPHSSWQGSGSGMSPVPPGRVLGLVDGSHHDAVPYFPFSLLLIKPLLFISTVNLLPR